jgi:hypothetical protein
MLSICYRGELEISERLRDYVEFRRQLQNIGTMATDAGTGETWRARRGHDDLVIAVSMAGWYLENPGPNMGLWEFIGARPACRLRIIVSRSILVRASTTVPSASCPAPRRRYQRPAPSNPWNHLRAPPHHRLWDRRNGSMRSLRVKRRCCALKGSVPAGRSRRSRFPRVLPRRVAVRGRINRSQGSGPQTARSGQMFQRAVELSRERRPSRQLDRLCLLRQSFV